MWRAFSSLIRQEDEAMHVALQNVTLPARLRLPVTFSDDDLMAFSQANKPCKVERLASGEILVMTPGGYKNNLREAYVVHELFSWAESDGRGR
jgi:Uma2 family endonuclease